MNEGKDALLELIRDELDAAETRLSPAIRGGLAAARRAALAQAQTAPGFAWRDRLRLESLLNRPAFAAGLVAASALLVLNLLPGPRPAASAPELAAQMEILGSEPGLAFYRNLEFNAWLAEGEHAS